MTPDRRYPDRVPRGYADRPRYVGRVPAGQRARYGRGPAQSTLALTMKLLALAAVGMLLIGGLIAAQLASGNDPALGPKALAQAKRSTAKSTSNGSSNSSSNGSASDPYNQSYYGGDGYYYGGSSGYSSGSGSSSGSSGYSYTPPPVTSSTS